MQTTELSSLTASSTRRRLGRGFWLRMAVAKSSAFLSTRKSPDQFLTFPHDQKRHTYCTGLGTSSLESFDGVAIMRRDFAVIFLTEQTPGEKLVSQGNVCLTKNSFTDRDSKFHAVKSNKF